MREAVKPLKAKGSTTGRHQIAPFPQMFTSSPASYGCYGGGELLQDRILGLAVPLATGYNQRQTSTLEPRLWRRGHSFGTASPLISGAHFLQQFSLERHQEFHR